MSDPKNPQKVRGTTKKPAAKRPPPKGAKGVAAAKGIAPPYCCFYQEKSNWCWAACMQMAINRFLGNKVEQCVIATTVLNAAQRGPSMSGSSRNLLKEEDCCSHRGPTTGNSREPANVDRCATEYHCYESPPVPGEDPRFRTTPEPQCDQCNVALRVEHILEAYSSKILSRLTQTTKAIQVSSASLIIDPAKESDAFKRIRTMLLGRGRPDERLLEVSMSNYTFRFHVAIVYGTIEVDGVNGEKLKFFHVCDPYQGSIQVDWRELSTAYTNSDSGTLDRDAWNLSE
ncbi:hypothetical protein WMF30_14205 [Sorangium sp. So ce134]